jgi:hypothetical protein
MVGGRVVVILVLDVISIPRFNAAMADVSGAAFRDVQTLVTTPCCCEYRSLGEAAVEGGQALF